MTVVDRTLPLVQAPTAGACCGACAGAAVAAEVAGTGPAVGTSGTLDTMAVRRTISRTDDRRLTFAGLVTAAGLLGLALVSLALPEAIRRGPWLPLHLALAGAASTAIAAVLPFFTAALAVAPPAGRPTRILAIGGIAGGALVVSGGVAAGLPAVAVGGGSIYLGGLAAVAAAAFGPLRGAFGPRRPLVTRAYGAALAAVAVGVLVSTAFLAGWAPVVERWALLKPAHAWLNVVGFLSVVVAATLVHLAPTVVGARMRPRASARAAIIGLTVGAAAVALGLGVDLDPVVIAGAWVTTAGAGALVAHGAVVHRERATWTTDPSWHRLTSWSLLLAPVWLFVAVVVAAARFTTLGADPAAWDIAALATPLAVGWVAQVLVGSWSHLLPAIGPGDPLSHARQRAILGTGATARLVALDGGVTLATAGVLASAPILVPYGLGLAAVSVAASLALFVIAARISAVVPRSD